MKSMCLALLACLSTTVSYADSFTIYNTTNQNIYITSLGASYDLMQCGKAQLKSCINITPQASIDHELFIPPQSSTVITVKPASDIQVTNPPIFGGISIIFQNQPDPNTDEMYTIFVPYTLVSTTDGLIDRAFGKDALAMNINGESAISRNSPTGTVLPSFAAVVTQAAHPSGHPSNTQVTIVNTPTAPAQQ
ncbi:MAG: hypothetical protein EBX40_01585 [Gammaproteobacteria bacterium]|nr:hypothetical protein [Gammaproteobacteria bacterium]